MATSEGGQYSLTFLRGETRNYVFVYRPRDKTLPPFVITGQTVEMRIRPQGKTEIVYTNANPGCYISDGANGEITVNPTGATKTAYDWSNAPYVILLQGKRLLYGTVTVKGLYE